MASFCTQCGKEIAPGVAFCTECGTKVAAVPQTPNTSAPAPASRPDPAAPVTDSSQAVVGTGTFFGLQFLFGIPIIGWIACLLMAFTAGNKNIRHYARAMLIWLLIGAVLAVGLYFLAQWVFDAAAGLLQDLMGGLPGGLGDVLDQFGAGDLSGLLGQLGEAGQLGDLSELLGQLGGDNDLSALSDLLGKLGEGSDLGDLNDLLDQYGDLSGILDQIGSLPTIPAE